METTTENIEIDVKFSCDGFPTDTSTSSKLNFPCDTPGEPLPIRKQLEGQTIETPPLICSPMPTSSSSSTTSPISSARFQSACRVNLDEAKQPPNLSYETAIAKSLLQQYSTLTGDNLFDHLADIIRRVIDERPPNVVDFFEEFSRSVREQKFHLPERFPPDAIYSENRMFRVAQRLLMSMKLPYPDDQPDHGEDFSEGTKSALDLMRLDDESPERLFITFNERVQHLQFYWNQCGFSISNDDIFQLACAMHRLQTHPNILQCRFWGVMNGLKAPYYIVEATLTRDEVSARLDQMERDLEEKEAKGIQEMLEGPKSQLGGSELIPGKNGWENHPVEELDRMQPTVKPVPNVPTMDVFEIPPEVVGRGTNRYSYFVVNTFSDDWIELPIVTSRQIVVSRQMKKFLTGDLEEEFDSYPCFPGKEKHYLRALIGRITAGTYIAPADYYRKMTPREQRLFDGDADEMGDEEEEEEAAAEGEDEEEEIENDLVLLRNEKYKPPHLTELTSPENWVHVRPNILQQGRVAWYDEEQARRDCMNEVKRLMKLREAEEMGVEEDEGDIEDEEEEEGEEEETYRPDPEIGPALLSECSNDVSTEFTVPWLARFTSRFVNEKERLLVMQSNVWPGAYSFVSGDNLCESIYMGWGHKYNARNMPFVHLSEIHLEFPHGPDDFIEATDPSVEEEEAYRLSLLRKDIFGMGEEMDEFDVDAEEDDNTPR